MKKLLERSFYSLLVPALLLSLLQKWQTVLIFPETGN